MQIMLGIEHNNVHVLELFIDACPLKTQSQVTQFNFS